MIQRATQFLPCLLLVAFGCNAPEVERNAETARFQNEIVARLASYKIDPTKPIPMERCVEIALKNNIAYRVQQLEQSIQDEKVREKFSDMLPKANASYTWTQRSNDAAIKSGGVTTELYDQTLQGFSIQATMPIMDWGVTRYAYIIAKDQRKQGLLMVTRSSQTLARDVRIAYVRLAGLQRREQLARVGMLAANELLKVAKSLEREGLAARADTAQVEASLSRAALEWSAINRNCEEASIILRQLMSLPAGTSFTIDNRLPKMRPLVKTVEILSLEDSALRSRPELFVQDTERHIAANSVRKRFAEFFPSLDGMAGFNWTSQSGTVNPSFFNYGVQVTDSLLDGGSDIWRYRAATKAADVEQERTLLLSLAILYDVDLRVVQLYGAYDAMVANEATVRAQQEALKQAVSEYIQGLGTGTDTVRSLAQMYLARIMLDAAQTEYQAAWFGLDAAALPDIAAAAPPAPTTAKPVPAYHPMAALDTLQQMLEAVPPVDLRQYPELQELLNAAEPNIEQPHLRK